MSFGKSKFYRNFLHTGHIIVNIKHRFNHNLGGGNSNTNLGVIYLDRGAISALAIGAISPRYAPGCSQYSDFVLAGYLCVIYFNNTTT